MVVATLALAADAFVVPAQPIARVTDATTSDAIRAILASGRLPASRWPLLTDVRADLRLLYGTGAAVPLWSTGGAATASARVVVEQLGLLSYRGLEPGDYDADSMGRLARREFMSPQVADALTSD